MDTLTVAGQVSPYVLSAMTAYGTAASGDRSVAVKDNTGIISTCDNATIQR